MNGYCKNCVYYRIDEETGEEYCRRTYSGTSSESSRDCFVDDSDY